MNQRYQQENTQIEKQTQTTPKIQNPQKLNKLDLEEKIALDLTDNHTIIACIRSDNSQPKNYNGNDQITYLFTGKLLHEIKDKFEQKINNQAALTLNRTRSKGPLDDEYFEYKFSNLYKKKIYGIAEELAKEINAE
ncbi:MAG: hypothetical protein ACP5OG_03880 [Candidatus Nanoarchaeia archaeon]